VPRHALVLLLVVAPSRTLCSIAPHCHPRLLPAHRASCHPSPINTPPPHPVTHAQVEPLGEPDWTVTAAASQFASVDVEGVVILWMTAHAAPAATGAPHEPFVRAPRQPFLAQPCRAVRSRPILSPRAPPTQISISSHSRCRRYRGGGRRPPDPRPLRALPRPHQRHRLGATQGDHDCLCLWLWLRVSRPPSPLLALSPPCLCFTHASPPPTMDS